METNFKSVFGFLEFICMNDKRSMIKHHIILPPFDSKIIQKIISATVKTCVSSTFSLFLSVLQNASGDPAVSSTVNPLTTKRSKVKTEVEGPLPISPSSQV